MIAKRYGRTEDTVCVSIDHSACMIMGGTYDGSYLLTITSLSMISPTCNKRNAALISDWMSNNLGVSVGRGYIRFVDPEFANYAIGGFTMLDLMEKEELTRTGVAEKVGVLRERSTKRTMSRHRSTKKERHSHERQAPDDYPVAREEDDTPSDLPSKIESPDRPTTAPGTKMKKRSLLNLFSKSKMAQ
jgi:Macrophage migration inhibitory factor (MIF)